MDDPTFDVYVENINWGNCYFISKSEERNKISSLMHKRVLAAQQKQEDWDLFVHVTIPNEFERKAKFNVGVTARN